jgi:hypothetical protein
MDGNIITHMLKERGFEDADWISLAQKKIQWGALVTTDHGNEPLGCIEIGVLFN